MFRIYDLNEWRQSSKQYQSLLKFIADYPNDFKVRQDDDKKGSYWIRLSTSPIVKEICDVFNDAGERTGQTVVRGTQLQQGLYYLVVQVWIRNELGQYLIQQRAPHLLSGAGMWATTAGYVVSGEDSLSGAMRELREELSLELRRDRFSRFDRLFMNGLMQDIWIA